MAYVRNVTIGNSGTDATSYATASVSPTNGRVLLAWVATQITAGTPNTPTASGTNGFSGTWTAIANVVQDQTKLTLFRSTAASGTAGVLTFDLGGQTNSAAVWGVDEWVDVNTTINVQSTTTGANAATNLTFSPSLAAFASSLNGVYACVAAAGSFVTVRQNATQGFMLQVPQAANSNGEIGGCSFYCPGEVNAPQIACSGAGSDMVGIAIEVSNSLSGGGSTSSDTFLPTFRV